MAPFRLLDLPYVVLRHILKSDVNVSKCAQLVREARLKDKIIVGRIGGIQHISLGHTNEPRPGKINYAFFELFGPKEEMEETSRLPVRGHNIWMGASCELHNLMFLFCEDPFQTSEALKCFIKSVVYSPIHYHLSVDGVPNFRQYYLDNVINGDCEQVELYGKEIRSIERNAKYEPIPSDIMEFVLDETPSHCELVIVTPPVVGFQYQKKLKEFKNFSMELPVGVNWETVFPNNPDVRNST